MKNELEVITQNLEMRLKNMVLNQKCCECKETLKRNVIRHIDKEMKKYKIETEKVQRAYRLKRRQAILETLVDTSIISIMKVIDEVRETLTQHKNTDSEDFIKAGNEWLNKIQDFVLSGLGESERKSVAPISFKDEYKLVCNAEMLNQFMYLSLKLDNAYIKIQGMLCVTSNILKELLEIENKDRESERQQAL